MILVTGDIHIPVEEDLRKLNRKNFPQQKTMGRKDYLIICGDFGGVWDNSRTDEYWLDWLEEKKFTTLFVDGNHENHVLLKDYPRENWHGGYVHKIREHVIHLERGQVFTLEGKKFFTMGGAASHDREFRREGINWWKEELPSEEECQSAIRKLEEYDYSVDYVITHCLSDEVWIDNKKYPPNSLTCFFTELEKRLSYRHWYCGHYHIDLEVDKKHTVMYQKIKKVVS